MYFTMLRITAVLVLLLIVCVTTDRFAWSRTPGGWCNENNWRRQKGRLRFPIKCKPTCKGGCPNGVCRAPNICECNSDSIRSPWGTCLKTCSATSKDGELCQGGKCKDGKCVCTSKLYTPRPDNKYCEPVCRGGCGEGGRCRNPGVCDCSKGYKLELQIQNIGKAKKYPTHRCVPDCGNGYYPCGKHGSCVAPNTCKCHEGFALVNNKC